MPSSGKRAALAAGSEEAKRGRYDKAERFSDEQCRFIVESVSQQGAHCRFHRVLASLLNKMTLTDVLIIIK